MSTPDARGLTSTSARRPEPGALPRGLTDAIAPFLDRLITPALVIDLDAVAHNIAATISRVGGPERWRPHLKTTKQAVIVEAMLAAGMRHFKVATCDELALTLRTAGHTPVDVLLAYPVQRAALEAVLELRARSPLARVSVLADSPAHLDALALWLGSERIPVMLDVDLGMDRTGSDPRLWRTLERLPAACELVGLHGYDGHLGWHERERAWDIYGQLTELAGQLADRLGIAKDRIELLTSGTHSYAHALAYDGWSHGPWTHRVSPGTIVLSDLRSHEAAADIGLRQAAFVATRVVSTSPGRVTLDAGSKGIAPDVAAPNCAVLGHDELTPRTPSEEHLPCTLAEGAASPALGELMWLIPAHVCTTVNLYREVVLLRGGRFSGVGPIGASGHRPRFELGETEPRG